MTTAADMSRAITATVQRYLELLAKGSAEELVALFADDATVEDPVGSEVRVGRAAIHAFFAALESLDRETELVAVRVAGQEAAFQFAITFDAGDDRMRLEPIDTLVFNTEGRITALRSYFSPSDVRQL
jgi:steroid delta-isomerase